MPKTKFETILLAAEFYFRFQVWLNAILQGPSSISWYTISRKSLNARLSYRDSTFSQHIFIPTLPTAKRHSAVRQAIYMPTNLTLSRRLVWSDEWCGKYTRLLSFSSYATSFLHTNICHHFFILSLYNSLWSRFKQSNFNLLTEHCRPRTILCCFCTFYR